jgi:hypothetical protein
MLRTTQSLREFGLSLGRATGEDSGGREVVRERKVMANGNSE